MFKKKCPACGAKNPKERMVCAECGFPLAQEKVKTPLSHEPIEAEPLFKAETKAAPKARTKDEYRDNERVLYRTRAWVSTKSGPPLDAGVLVTEENIIIETQGSFKIPLSALQNISTDSTIYSVNINRANYIDLNITYLDRQNENTRLSLQVVANEELELRRAIYRQIVGRYINVADEDAGKPTIGRLFFGFKEQFRDKMRDRICAGMQMAGIDAQLAARGRFEEEIWDINFELRGFSLGIIRISEGAIRWANVRKEPGNERSGRHRPIIERPDVYFIDYGVPDPKLDSDSPLPLFRFVDAQWEGNDFGTGILERLNNDDVSRQPLLDYQNAKIAATADYGCWIISTKALMAPSAEQWRCYLAVARHLLIQRSR